LVSSPIFAKTAASKVLKVYSPAPLVWRVGCEFMLGVGRPFADSSNVLLDINRQITEMMRIPRIIRMSVAGFGKRSGFAAEQKANSQ
jgi:hypothetical protein